MSRQKIAAATMMAAALGLGFVGYIQATRASNTEEQDFQVGDESFSAHDVGLTNHQSRHDSAVFKWIEPERSSSKTPNADGEPAIGQCHWYPSASRHPLTDGADAHGDSADVPPPTHGANGGQAIAGYKGHDGDGAPTPRPRSPATIRACPHTVASCPVPSPPMTTTCFPWDS